MPNASEPSVVHWKGCDYWRTWFLVECEATQLFGVTQKHLGLITIRGIGVEPYHIGTQIFLEDAPYFYRGKRTHHRICGPYEIIATDDNLPQHAIPEHIVENKIIVYKDAYPENGPWFDKRGVRRNIDEINITFDQVAKEYDYFPYRFRIRRAPPSIFKVEHKEHNHYGCWLCEYG